MYTGAGKSTGINTLLQDNKSKEYNKVFEQTKNSAIYQVKNLPIKFIKFPGYDGHEYSLKELFEILKKFGIMFIWYYYIF